LGRIINVASSDFQSIDEHIPAKLYQIILHGVAVITSLIVVAFTTPLFLLASPFIAFIYFLIQKYYLHTSRVAKRVFRITKSPVFQDFQETLAGVSTIRAMGLQDRFIKANSRWCDIHANAFVAYGYCIRWMEIQVQMINVFITLLVALWFVLLPQGSVNAATAGLALSFAMSNAQALIWLTRHYCDMYLHLIAIERVEEYSEMRTEAPLLTVPDSEAGRALDKHWPQEGKIEFFDYSTRYREGMDLILRSISFTIEGGQKVGIVGRTGAGKSSLTLALFRMIEAANSEWAKATSSNSNQESQDQNNHEEDQMDGGKIVIDNIDISTLGLADLRKNLSIIPQEPTVMDSDRILVLDHGRVVEYDAPKVLLQDENSLFYKLAKQAGES
ncbi:Multidrug resistance-associated protein 1, partial [Haplosporangium gracile]